MADAGAVQPKWNYMYENTPCTSSQISFFIPTLWQAVITVTTTRFSTFLSQHRVVQYHRRRHQRTAPAVRSHSDGRSPVHVAATVPRQRPYARYPMRRVAFGTRAPVHWSDDAEGEIYTRRISEEGSSLLRKRCLPENVSDFCAFYANLSFQCSMLAQMARVAHHPDDSYQLFLFETPLVVCGHTVFLCVSNILVQSIPLHHHRSVVSLI